MAISTCVKCGNHYFELAESQPNGSNYKIYFVQCTHCGGVVGTMDWYPVGTNVRTIMNTVADMETKLKSLASSLHGVETKVNRLK